MLRPNARSGGVVRAGWSIGGAEISGPGEPTDEGDADDDGEEVAAEDAADGEGPPASAEVAGEAVGWTDGETDACATPGVRPPPFNRINRTMSATPATAATMVSGMIGRPPLVHGPAAGAEAGFVAAGGGAPRLLRLARRRREEGKNALLCR
jgi:hypothetical protein